MSLRVVSYGGGVQSTALLVLAAQRRIDFPTFLMANVGDDSEHPATLEYVRSIAMPYAEQHGIDLRMLERHTRDGQVETIRGRVMREDRKSQVIPVRSSAEGPPMSRSCTVDFKIEVLGRFLRDNGAGEDDPATVGIGISVDEMHRANRKSRPYERIVYPLLDYPKGSGDGNTYRRNDCQRIIREAGLPVPPKSSCYFCPFHSLEEWVRLRREEPDLFDDAARMEATISAKTGQPRYLTRYGRPLAQVVPRNADMLPLTDDGDDGSCESGWCFT